MRFLYIILLCGVVIQSVSITNAKTTSKSSDLGDSATTIATSRFLRIYDKDDDERAFGI
ncbi:RxLR effector protein, partial [Phytophthora megakarya]